jgi:hypothetical protein
VPDEQLNPKKNITEQVLPDCKTNGSLVATYKGVPWTVKVNKTLPRQKERKEERNGKETGKIGKNREGTSARRRFSRLHTRKAERRVS